MSEPEGIITGAPTGQGDLVPKYPRANKAWRASCRHCFRSHDVTLTQLLFGRCPWRADDDSHNPN